MDENSFTIQLSKYIPNRSRFHPRQIVGVTCTQNVLKREYEYMINLNCYFDHLPQTFHVWYTLPWAFDQFFTLKKSNQYITKVETCAPSQCNSSMIYTSQLRTLDISQNKSLPSIVSMPHVVQFNRINTVHLSFHD
ncbi:hypothetical protein I4U23_027675 [Adineta vaga]|nr:hypothetical protein I4U23_027675 [Adineta vaga]